MKRGGGDDYQGEDEEKKSAIKQERKQQASELAEETLLHSHLFLQLDDDFYIGVEFAQHICDAVDLDRERDTI